MIQQLMPGDPMPQKHSTFACQRAYIESVRMLLLKVPGDKDRVDFSMTAKRLVELKNKSAKLAPDQKC